MTKSEIMQMAHAEAKQIVASKRISYREALVFGLRRAHNKALQDRNVAIMLAKAETPKFMWLRGM